jgi:hypothetical protein
LRTGPLNYAAEQVDSLGRQSELWLSTILSAAEVVRRFLWTMVRIESEHAKTLRLPMLEGATTTSSPAEGSGRRAPAGAAASARVAVRRPLRPFWRPF